MAHNVGNFKVLPCFFPVNSAGDLADLEARLQSQVLRYKLDQWLLKIHNKCLAIEEVGEDTIFYPPYLAGLASFVIRNTSPIIYSGVANSISDDQFLNTYKHIVAYLQADPVSFDGGVREYYHHSDHEFLPFRLLCQQVPFLISPTLKLGQALLFYEIAPKRLSRKENIAHFDLAEQFESLVGTSLREFLKIGLFISGQCRTENGFALGLVKVSRDESQWRVTDQAIHQIMDLVSADREKFRRIYEDQQVSDRRFRMYSFNPLLVCPLIKPWEENFFGSSDNVRLIAPIPNLVFYTFTAGIFYLMMHRFKTAFTNYFGHLFEAATEVMLERLDDTYLLFREGEIRRSYPSGSGKCPDFAILEGSTLILIECKSTYLLADAMTSASEEAIDNSMEQVMGALRQLNDFSRAVMERQPGLEDFHEVQRVTTVALVFDTLMGDTCELLRSHLLRRLNDGAAIDFDWQIMSFEQLAMLEPYITAGISLSATLDKLRCQSVALVLNDLKCLTSFGIERSLLAVYEDAFFCSLGFPSSQRNKFIPPEPS
ncbi:MAG: hypothetical protein HYY96_02795 [Candidatus Tectomicrobia bacterium]|nr:hypothetical protein [Candidatus Tectomicrobia bacterium]